jgi:hypothetical protein
MVVQSGDALGHIIRKPFTRRKGSSNNLSNHFETPTLEAWKRGFKLRNARLKLQHMSPVGKRRDLRKQNSSHLTLGVKSAAKNQPRQPE